MAFPRMYFDPNPPKGFAPNMPPSDQMGPRDLELKAFLDAKNAADVQSQPPPTQQDLNAQAQPLPAAPSPPSSGVGANGYPFGMSPYTENPEYKALIQQLQDQSQGAIAGQQRGVDEAAANLEAYKKIPSQLDLSPLMALSDTWYGGNQQKGYTKPEGTQDKVGMISALQGGLQKARGSLSQEQLQFLKDRLGLLQKGDETKASLLMAAAKMKESGANADYIRGARTDRQTNDRMQALSKSIGDSLPSIHEQVTQLKALVPELNQPPTGAASVAGIGMEKFTPDFLKSTKAQYISQSVQGIAADLLRFQSGLTVSEAERANKVKQLGIGAFNTPQQFVKAMQDMQRQMQRVMANKEAPFKDIKAQYKANGGLSSEDFAVPASANEGAAQQAVAAGGGLPPELAAELAKRQAAGH